MATLSLRFGNELKKPLKAPKTLPEVLFATSNASQDSCITYLPDDITETYGELWNDSLRVARGLKQQGIQPQQIVILQFEEIKQFLTAFWGAQLAGAVVAPIAPPPSFEQSNSHTKKLEETWNFLGKPVVITSQAILSKMQAWAQAKKLDSFSAIGLENLLQSEKGEWHRGDEKDLALLLFTSGSTGSPKGVMLTHENLLSMATAMIDELHMTKNDVVLNWMPFDHVGAIAFMHIPYVFLGCRQIHMPTHLVQTDPLKWLEGIARFKATATWAPNFAYNMVCDYEKEIETKKWDLSSVRYFFNGGETIVAKTAVKFLEILATKGLSSQAHCPCWGMSETASAVIFNCNFNKENTNNQEPFVELGSPTRGFAIRIVDEESHIVSEEVVGRFQVKGPSVTQGYYNLPTMNEKAFTQDGWFDTGDNGFLRNGKLYLTGRNSDTIIVAGVNYYSHQIESAIEELPEIKTSNTAAIAVRGPEDATEEIAVFFVPKEDYDSSQMNDLFRKIRNQVNVTIGTTPKYLIPLAIDEIPKTAIGKIQRNQLKKNFANGEYKHFSEQGDVITFFKKNFALGDEFLPESDIHAMGFNSIEMIKFLRMVEKEYRVKFTARDLYQLSSLRNIAKEIRNKINDGILAFPLPTEEIRAPQTGLRALSETQKGFFAMQKIFPSNLSYLLPLCLRFGSPLDSEKMKKAFQLVLEKHSILKSLLVEQNSIPYLQGGADLTFISEDISHLQDHHIISYLDKKWKEPFTEGNLLRVHHCSKSKEENYLVIVLHHIIFDGVSSLIFLNDLFDAYKHLLSYKECHIVTPQASYDDFVSWEQAMLSSPAAEKHSKYWKEALEDFDFHPSFQQKGPLQKRVVTKSFSSHVVGKIKNFAKTHSKSTSTLLLATYFILLHRMTKRDDIAVAMPATLRPQERFDGVLGPFLNMLPIRMKLRDESCLNLLERLFNSLLDGLDHVEYPFSKMIKDLKIEGVPPFFEAAFFYQNFFQNTSYKQICDSYKEVFAVEFMKEIQQEGQYPFLFEIWEEQDQFTLHIKYDSNVFSEESIEAAWHSYITLLEFILDNPLANVKTIFEEESKTPLQEWNETHEEFPHLCFHQLFEEQALKTPEAVAIAFEDSFLTYRELNEKSSLFASYLQSQGVKSEKLVGICLERSLEMAISLIAILKAGGAYVPLDPHYPLKQLEQMVRDSNVELIVTEDKFKSLFSSSKTITYDQQQENFTLKDGIQPHHLAYVIFTSGSTGKPKGVMISHLALTNFLVAMSRKSLLGPSEKLLAITTINFDIAALELFLPLIVGGTCVICSSENAKNPEKLIEVIKKTRPHLLQATPATWKMLFHTGWKNEEGLKILCGGEALTPDLKQRFIATDSKAWNMFGPTETTVWSTMQAITEDKPISIGRPIANTTVYILNESLEPVDIGVQGELYIGGLGVAHGYWNDPQLTKQKFLDNPFRKGEKFFKTGDLARWLPDGEIEYLGRNDSQVKIRGFRIELGAIDAKLSELDGIRESATVVKEESGFKKLVTYFVSKDERSSPTDHDVRLHLQNELPPHMVPSHIVQLKQLPYTPNGKIDRRELAQREIVIRHSSLLEKLKKIWQETIQVKNIGLDDRFFDVGGDSLLAVATAERIKNELNDQFSVTELFAHPTLRKLSAFLEAIGGELEQKNAPSDLLDECVAIIGLSCQFPGAKNPFEFWNNLKEGKESIKFYSKEELRELGVATELIEHPDYIPAMAPFVGKELFDPEFFHLSAKDASLMDPQMRHLLLHAWKAVEDGGYVSNEIPETAVYVSVCNNCYHALLQTSHSLATSEGYVSWALAQHGTIPTMISFKLGLKGPSYFVHSNCSSSLVGLKAGFQSIVSGETKYALVGAATLHATSQVGHVHQKGLNFSSDGHLRAFDEKADGMVAGEGVAVILLKSAKLAIEDRDPIYAILRGVALNNDGDEKAGFYAPSVQGQTHVIEKVLEKTKISPESISYIEAHGTGTTLGDPIEIAALSAAYKTEKKQYCAIGSVKTNLGHLDTAAGLAGCLKVVLSLSHNELVPTLNFTKPNPNLNLSQTPFFVLDKGKLLDKNLVHRAALSSFGIGGTNAHAIFESYQRHDLDASFSPPFLIPLSAKNQKQLLEYAKDLLHFIKQQPCNLESLAYTFQVGRKAMEARAIFVADTMEIFGHQLEKYCSQNAVEGCYCGVGEKIGESIDEKWIREKNFHQIAHLWSLGSNLNWNLLYPKEKPLRIHAPTYPFDLKICTPHLEPEEEIYENTQLLPMLQTMGAKIVKMKPLDLHPMKNLSDYGFDSISFVEFAKQINLTFHLDITPDLFFECKTLGNLAATLAKKITPQLKKPSQKKSVRQVLRETSEAIAIVGMSGEFPQAENLKHFWKNLEEGKDCISEIPSDRWDWRKYFGDPKKEANKTDVKWGGFLDSVAKFDPLFFGISPREAYFIDPQHRLLLMHAWSAIEDAGINPKSLSGTKTGVFVGTGNTGYKDLFTQANLPIEGHAATGHMIPSLGPNRLSYFLDIHGPSEPVETSCSSSLVAIHRAVCAMQDGSCDMAITGGINTIVIPEGYISYSKAGMLSLDGKCKAFSKYADGYVRAEGAGIIFLKKLSEAKRDKNPIYGIIRASATNHGGRANTLTSPNPKAQADVLKSAYARAGIDPNTITYIEAHGSGTELGDPIEINGLKSAFQADESDKSRCGIGTVKSNIGHAEVAAGIAGVLKVLLQMKHKTLIKSLHTEELNPYLQLEKTPFYIVQEKKEWTTQNNLPRRAGVSSFGIGGVNAHIVLEEYQENLDDAFDGPFLIVLSAKNEKALRKSVENLLENASEHTIASLAYTLQVGREAMEVRLGVIVNDTLELVKKLKEFLNGSSAIENLFFGEANGEKENLSLMVGDDDIDQAIKAWISKRKYSKLLHFWVRGLFVDWNQLYGETKPKLISLPTYPFAKDRYWIPGAVEKREREIHFLQKNWEIQPCVSEKKKASVMILATEETLVLANMVAMHFDQNCIIDAQNPREDAIKNPKEWDGWIDLIGCGQKEDLTLKWMSHLQHLVEHGHKNGMVFLGVTKGGEPYKNSTISLAGATSAGLYRMLQSEYSHLKSRHLDLGEGSLLELADQIATEFFALSDDPEVCYRNGLRHVSHLQTVENLVHSDFVVAPFQKDEVLIITGGTRGIGALCAEHFVENYGVKKLVLIGREELPPKELWNQFSHLDTPQAKKIRFLQSLEKKGASVRAISANLTDQTLMSQVMDEIRQQMGQIKGVIHCAGMVDMNTLAFIRKTEESRGKVLDPKISGTITLYNLLHDDPLRFFVLFSSVSGIIPYLAAGQSDYTQANAYLDYFAQKHKELPIVSIQWPNWKEVGMGEVTNKAYLDSGILSITNREGLRFLDQILHQQKISAVLPAVVDPEIWKPHLLMKHTTKPLPRTKETQVVNTKPLTENGVLNETQKWLIGLFAKELTLAPEEIKIHKPFQDYGVDSIILVQILHWINERISEHLDPSILYEYPTIESFSQWLVKGYSSALAPTKPTEEIAESFSQQLVKGNSPAFTKPTEEIAVVGMSCRFAGAPDVEQYWKLLSEGRSAIAPVPEEKWGYRNSFYAALLDTSEEFDREFFQISQEDVLQMDPQAFLVLEESLKLWYHAGYDPQDFKGKPVGVYIGARSQHTPDAAGLFQMRNPILAVGQNYLAANVSQFFDLRGPSMVIDTACSSSLVCMNIAIQALRTQEITAAVCGGVGFLQTDGALQLFQQRKLLNQEGAFHVFDERASGIVLGEGAGLVLLKTVSQALKDGDEIYAVIKGIAINNDGKTAGPSTPSFEAQKDVMKEALGKSGKCPAEIEYIEGNGSGSIVTDLLELKAIQSIYRQEGMKALRIGSIKPNIGHPLCAEGIASFIKVVLMLKKGQFVPFISGQNELVHFNLKKSGFIFARDKESWTSQIKCAGINCFADGGTNAHVIVESWNEVGAKRAPKPFPALKKRKIVQNSASKKRKNIWDTYAVSN